MQKWTRAAQRELTECFGGATAVPAPGTNVLAGRIVFEEGQLLVVSACDRRQDFLARRARILRFARRMGAALDQESVFVLAVPSDSFLVELEPKTRR